MVQLVVDQNALDATVVGLAALLVRQLVVHTVESQVKMDLGLCAPEDDMVTKDIKLTSKTQSWGADALSKEQAKKVKRWQRIVMNDLENIPLAACIMVASLLCIQDDPGCAKIHMYAVAAFVEARFMHSFFYAMSMQPWRTISYFIGLGATIVMLGNAGSLVYNRHF